MKWKNKVVTVFAIIALVYVCAGFGCNIGKKPVGTGGGNAGSDWEFVQSISSTWIVLPTDRPPLRSGPNSVKIYSDRLLSAAEIQNYTAGIQQTLDASNWNNPRFSPVDWWQKDGKPFSRLEDYSIMLMPPMGVSESEERRGCGLIHVRVGFDLVTAIGTNAGQILINGIPRAPGGLYLVIAAPADNEPAESNCDSLRREGTANEAEHARTMGVPALWFAVQEIDFTTGHPFFNRPGETPTARIEMRQPDGTTARADYAPASPTSEQIRSINLTPEQMIDLGKRYPNLAEAWKDKEIQRQLAE